MVIFKDIWYTNPPLTQQFNVAMTRHVLFLFVVFFQIISGFILPLTKPSGDPDLTSIISHITLMESSMSKLETRAQASHDQLILVKAELKTAQEKLRSAEADIITLQNDKILRPNAAELTTMKSDLADLKSSKAQHSSVNLTIVDVMSRDLKTNTVAIQVLRSKVDANSVKINITNSNTTQGSHDQLNVVKADLKTTQTRLSSAEADIITLQHDKKTSSGAIQDLQYKVEVNSVNINNTRVDGELNGLQQKKLRDEVTHLITDVNNTKNVAKIIMAEVQTLKTHQNNVESNRTRQAVATLESLAMLTHVEVHQALVNIHSLELHVKTNLSAAVRELVSAQLPTQLSSELSSQLPTQLSSELSSQLPSLLSSQLSNQLSSQLPSLLSSQLSSLQHNLENQIDQASMDVAFQVTQSGDTHDWTTLHFNTVDFNQGGGYNSASGYFTAPVSGTYLFWCNILIYHSNGQINIYKGSTIIAQGFTYTDDNQVAMTAVTHLDKGDQVHFTADRTSIVTDGDESHYGGALLHASKLHI